MALPPGLAGFVAARQEAQQADANQLQQLQGAIGLQNLVQQQAQAQDERARIQKVRDLALTDPRIAKDPLLGALVQGSKPDAVLPYLLPKQKDRNPVSVTGGYLTPAADGSYTFTRTAETKPEAPSSLTKLLKERDALPPNDPSRPMYDAAISKLTTHAPAPSATVINKQETEFGKTVGKEMGQQYSDLLKADIAAPQTISKYQRLGQLLDQVNTGKFTGLTTDLKAYAKGLGFDLTQMGIADNVAPAQASKALGNMLALELRNPAGGAGMPGALSDKDREFLVQSIPNLENDPKANEKMIDYRLRLARREQMVARLARDYRRKNGRFDEGFYDQLKEWSDKNPLFPEADSTPQAAPKPGRIRYDAQGNRIQ